MSNTLTSLDASVLDVITGGKSVGTKTGNNDAVLSSLSSLQSSVKDLAQKPQQSSLFGNPTNVMLFALLASQRPAASTTNVVYVRRRGW